MIMNKKMIFLYVLTFVLIGMMPASAFIFEKQTQTATCVLKVADVVNNDCCEGPNETIEEPITDDTIQESKEPEFEEPTVNEEPVVEEFLSTNNEELQEPIQEQPIEEDKNENDGDNLQEEVENPIIEEDKNENSEDNPIDTSEVINEIENVKEEITQNE